MAKDEREKLAKKLAKAQLKLREADEDVAATRVEGEQTVQRARLKAEKDLARARRELARRAEKVARLERDLHREEAGSPDGIATAEQAADVIERIEESHEPVEETLIIPS